MATRIVHTYCAQCLSFCAMRCTVEDGRLVRVVPDREHPSGGTLCPKGLAAPEIIYSSQRLLYPLRRTRPKGDADPGWKRITWEEALELVATRVLEIKERFGAEALTFYRPAKAGSPSGDYEPLLWRLAHALGSPNTLTTGHICQWHRDSGSVYTYGAGIPSPDLENSAGILLWGFNPHHTFEGFYRTLRRAQKRGAKLLVVDPRYTEVAREADLWLAPRPGTDGALALSILAAMVEEGLYDEDFARDWTNAPFLVRVDNGELLRGREVVGGAAVAAAGGLEDADLVAWDAGSGCLAFYNPGRRAFTSRLTPEGLQGLAGQRIDVALTGSYPVRLADGNVVNCRPVWQELLRVLEEFAPEATAPFTHVPARQVREAARFLAANRPLSYFTYNGIEQHLNAMQTNRALCLLYALTGNLGLAGGNLWWPTIPTNDLEGREFLPPSQRAKRLGLAEKPLGPPSTGRVAAADFYTAVLEGRPYPVKGLLAFGGNLLMANGDSRRAFRALSALDFYLQVDLYLTPAAQLADVVLPAATCWEGWFVRAGFGLRSRAARRRIQVRERVVAPQGESRPDQEIILDLACRLGLGDKFWDGDLEKALDYHLAPTGLTVAELRQHPLGVDYPLEPQLAAYAQIDPATGCPRGFQTPSGRIEVYSSRLKEYGYAPLPEAAALKAEPGEPWRQDFPLILTNFKLREYIHGQGRAIPSLRRKVPHPYVEVHPDTATNLKLDDGQMVSLETPVGRIRVRVKITNAVQPGVVATQHGWWQACPELGLPGYDPFSEAGANINLVITNDPHDPVTGSVPHKSYRCRLVSDPEAPTAR